MRLLKLVIVQVKTARLKFCKNKEMPFLFKKISKTVFKRKSQASTIFK